MLIALVAGIPELSAQVMDAAPGRPFDILHMPSVEFIAEQKGSFENQIKDSLVPVLKMHSQIHRAYLVAVRYAEGNTGVALCIESETGASEQIVKDVANTFRKNAGPNVVLDIIFLTDEQRPRVRNLAQAFYVAS
jgi:hypothetical protein